MADPPFPAPNRIQILGVLPGEFGSADGGGLVQVAANVSVHIDGDSRGVFSVLGLETFALVPSHDPDLPPGTHAREWESTDSAIGQGPIAIRKHQGLVATIRFGCPTLPDPVIFTATAAVVGDNAGPQPLMQIPIEARAGFPPIMVDAVGNLVRFTPEAVIVAPGTTVTWIVRDLGFPEDNLIIIGALGDGSDAVSPELKRGDRFGFTFARPGSYRFTFPKNPSEQGANVVVVLSH